MVINFINSELFSMLFEIDRKLKLQELEELHSIVLANLAKQTNQTNRFVINDSNGGKNHHGN